MKLLKRGANTAVMKPNVRLSTLVVPLQVQRSVEVNSNMVQYSLVCDSATRADTTAGSSA